MKFIKVLVIILIIGVVLGGIGYLALGGREGVSKLFASVERTETTIVEEQVVTSLSLNVSSDDIIFHKSADNKLKIVYFDYENSPYNYSFNEGTATLSEPSIEEMNWIEMLRIQRKAAGYSVQVYLPESCTGTITVRLTSGEVNLENWMCNRFDFEVSSGKINVKNLNANAITGQLSSGDCNLSDCTVENISVMASSGDIALSHITAEDLTAITTSGRIDIEGATAVNMILNTTSGGITCHRLSVESLKANSTSGQMTLDMLGAPEDYRIDAEISSGEIFISYGADKLVQTGDDIIYGNGSRIMDISAGSGGISVIFIGE